jgi:hypothetical protein
MMAMMPSIAEIIPKTRAKMSLIETVWRTVDDQLCTWKNGDQLRCHRAMNEKLLIAVGIYLCTPETTPETTPASSSLDPRLYLWYRHESGRKKKPRLNRHVEMDNMTTIQALRIEQEVYTPMSGFSLSFGDIETQNEDWDGSRIGGRVTDWW